MDNDRMMQVIGRIERAISRLEGVTDAIAQHSLTQAEALEAARARAQASEARAERLAASMPPAPTLPFGAPPAPANSETESFSHDKALAALRSLDSLIDDLQKARRDG